jgi:hypothetical protein
VKKVKSTRLIDKDKLLDNFYSTRNKDHTWDYAHSLIINAPTIDLAEPHWIPCSEKNPPEEAKRYWICTDGGYQCQCRWTNVNYFLDGLTTDWKWHFMDIPQYSEVVAWMPLPEPYKGGDTE